MLEDHEIQAHLTTMSFGLSSEGLWVSEDDQVGVALHDAGLFVGWRDVAWSHPSTPRRVLRDVQHLIPDSADFPASLDDAVGDARAQRAAAVCVCQSCGNEFVPGQMHDQRCCHGCAERELGVVH